MKKMIIGCLLGSAFLLGACQKSETKTEKSTTLQTSLVKSSSTVSEASSTTNSTTTDSSEELIDSTTNSLEMTSVDSTTSGLETASIASTSSLTTQETTTSSSEPTTIATAQQQLIGRSFLLAPSLYDGQDVDQAMSEQKAPQSLFHDGVSRVTFTDNSTAHVELAGAYRPDYDTTYTLTDTTLTVGDNTIPYSLDNGTLSFYTWTTDANGHTITWSFK